jgi:putative oxidoreductase
MFGIIPERWGPRLLSALRIVAGFLFLFHGTQKLFAWPVDEPRDPAALASLMGVAGILEVFGGILLMLGLWTRPLTFLLAGEMAVAYFMVHAPRGPWPILNNGELAALYCFLFLYLAAVGPGPWSLDAMRQRSKRGADEARR